MDAKGYLVKADKMSMASSLELRVPLLDIEMQSCRKQSRRNI